LGGVYLIARNEERGTRKEEKRKAESGKRKREREKPIGILAQ